MATFPMSVHAQDQVRNTHTEQVWFFVMSTRRINATALEAHINKTEADRRARLWRSGRNPPPDDWTAEFGPCVRVGRVVAGYATTI